MTISLRFKLTISLILVRMTLADDARRGIVGMSDINDEPNAAIDEQFLPARTIANANISLLAWNRAEFNNVLSENPERLFLYDGIMAEQREASLNRVVGLAHQGHLSAKGNGLLAQLQRDFEAAVPVRDQVAELSRLGNQEEARQLMRTRMRAVIDEDISRFLRLQETLPEGVIAQTDNRFDQALRRIILVAAIAMFGGIAAGGHVFHSLSGPLRRLSRGVREFASGDLRIMGQIISLGAPSAGIVAH